MADPEGIYNWHRLDGRITTSGQPNEAQFAEIRDLGVRHISPGSILVDGDGWDRYRLANPAHYEDYVRHGFPMGRLGTAEEVADVIVFAASPRARWINGRNFAVDGLEQPHAPLDRRPY